MIKLYPYQKEGVSLIHSFEDRALLADDPGLGKTAQALRWYAKYCSHQGPCIVVCPKIVKENWKKEISRFIGMHAYIMETTKPPKFNKGLIPRKSIWIINYDILKDWKKFITQMKPGTFIIDEAHNFQSMLTKRTKAGIEISKRIPSILAITGTPINSSPVNIYPIVHILWPWKFKSFRKFAYKYTHPEHRPWGWVFKGGRNLKKLNRLLKKMGMIRRRKKDVLKELPKKIITVTPIEIPKKEYKEYEEIEKDFSRWIERVSPERAMRVLKAEAIVKMTELRKKAGEIKMKYVREWINNFLESTDQKLIAFGIHKKFVRGLWTEYKGKALLIDGGVVQHKRDHAIRTFTESKDYPLMLANIKAANAGWNGQVASNVLIYEFAWNPTDHEQCIARADRIGQKQTVNATFLVAKNTIEEDILELNQVKQGYFDEMIDGKKQKDSFDIFDRLLMKLMIRRKDRK